MSTGLKINSVKFGLHVSNMERFKILLHHFCNTSSPDDVPKSGRKYLGNKQLWKIYQSIPAEYNKSNTAIWKDQQENM